jgi:hypothetical protein
VEHHHDNQYPAKEAVARYLNSRRPERICAAESGYLKSYFPSHKLPCLAKTGLERARHGEMAFAFENDTAPGNDRSPIWSDSAAAHSMNVAISSPLLKYQSRSVRSLETKSARPAASSCAPSEDEQG